MATASEVRAAKRKAIGGKRPRCRKGKSCSAACVARWKECLAEMPVPVSGAIPKAVRAIQERRSKLSPKERRQASRGRVESARDRRAPKAIGVLLNRMTEALNSGNLEEYKKAEESFLKIRDSYIKKDVMRKNVLFNKYGSDALSRKGQLLNWEVDQLKTRMRIEASNRNRREYNKIESRLLKLDPDAKAGEIWRRGVRNRAENYIPKLKSSMIDAAENGNRKKYNKLEKVLLKLDPNAEKNKIWKRVRLEGYASVMRGQLRNAAISGNRKKYDKLEKLLFKIDPNNRNNVRGRVWAQERIPQSLLDKLAKEMEKAAEAGNRERYDKLEGRFFRIKDKIGSSSIRDADLRYMSRGEKWREAEASKKFSDLKTALDEGKRRGVGDIKIKGTEDSFYINSDVLGNKVSIYVAPNDTMSFTVNGSYTASGTLSKREEFAITRETMRQFDETVKRMPDGVVFSVSAASGDGREEMREGAYMKFGFSPPSDNGNMYGMVMGGRMVAIDEDEYYDLSS